MKLLELSLCFLPTVSKLVIDRLNSHTLPVTDNCCIFFENKVELIVDQTSSKRFFILTAIKDIPCGLLLFVLDLCNPHVRKEEMQRVIDPDQGLALPLTVCKEGRKLKRQLYCSCLP